MKHPRTLRIFLIVGMLLAGGLILGEATRCWAIEATAGAEGAAGAPKTVSKIYVVGYTLVVLMVGLGILVVCHYRQRKARPDLPQDMVAERLRQGVKAPGHKQG